MKFLLETIRCAKANKMYLAQTFENTYFFKPKCLVQKEDKAYQCGIKINIVLLR
jgi:phage FluMu protein Com